MRDRAKTKQRLVDELVTERKAAEEALCESEERFRGTFEQAAVGMAHVARDGRYLRINQKFCDIVGYTREEMLSRRFQDITHPEDLDSDLSYIQRVLAGGAETYSVEKRYIRKDGSIVWGNLTVSLVREPSGEPAYFISVLEDISDRKLGEEALRQSEKKFRNIVESSPMGMHLYRLEPDGRLVFIGANPAADRLLGLDNSQFIGKTIEEAFPPLKDSEVPSRYRLAAEKGEPWRTEQIEYEDQRIKGAFEVYAFQTSPGHMAAMFLEISRRKRAEEEKEKLEAQLRHAQKMEAIGQLAGGVAHDFNNLLSPILGYAELLLMDLHPDDPRFGSLSEIRKAGNRAKDLTRQLLAFGRKQMIEMQVLDLGEIVSGFEKMLKRTIRENIEIQLQLQPSLGKVHADISQIELILMNLAVNAQDAMPKGGTMTLETADVLLDEESVRQHPDSQPGHYVMLAIRDTGSGIEPELLERIFEPFFTTKEKGKGTGLGLATVYGIVKQHKGEIIVDSEPGKGCAFKIYLPQVEGDAETLLRTPMGLTGNHGTEMVVVVEDDTTVRNLACAILREHGYRVFSAGSAEECISLFQKTGPVDLLLTDVVMPEMNGRELSQRLVATYPKLKVLFMSGYMDDWIANHGVPAEADNFIQKPFSIQTLTKKVRQVLDI